MPPAVRDRPAPELRIGGPLRHRASQDWIGRGFPALGYAVNLERFCRQWSEFAFDAFFESRYGEERTAQLTGIASEQKVDAMLLSGFEDLKGRAWQNPAVYYHAQERTEKRSPCPWPFANPERKSHVAP
jgi:hypothetical protein